MVLFERKTGERKERRLHWMIEVMLTILLALAVTSCGNDVPENDRNDSVVQREDGLLSGGGLEAVTEAEPEPESEAEQEEPVDSEETEEDTMAANEITIKVGESVLTAVLEDNESAKALKELLASGPLTIPASNYGGFEKVCALGTDLPKNDVQTTTRAGDICLYTGNQIVIFYGSNSWAYTRLGKVKDADASELETILRGEEAEITLSIEP